MTDTKKMIFEFLVQNKDLVIWKEVQGFWDKILGEMKDLIANVKVGHWPKMPKEYSVDCNEYSVSFIMEKEVAFYGPGKAFGELALIKNAPRAASIRGFNQNVELAILSKGSYNAVLGQI